MADNALSKVVHKYVPPSIYWFWCDEFEGLYGRRAKDFPKVGYTTQDVLARLEQWERDDGHGHNRGFTGITRKGHYASIPAFVAHNRFVKDYIVHHELVEKYGFQHLLMSMIPGWLPWSNEIFIGRFEDVGDAVREIISGFQREASEHGGVIPGVKTYDMETGRVMEVVYPREGEWKLRKPQQEVLDNFKRALAWCESNGVAKRFLLNATCRFGKTYTSLKLAESVDSRLTVILSAKTDVAEEWRAGVEKPGEFADWVFINARRARNYIGEHDGDTDYIQHYFDSGKHVVVFMSLQDLNGSLDGEVKPHHESLFKHGDEIDMLLCDETHYGIRAEKLGRSIDDSGENVSDGSVNDVDPDMVDDEPDDAGDGGSVENRVGDGDAYAEGMDRLVQGEDARLKYKYRVDISATPYRIIASGEYADEQIIANVGITDMYDYQRNGDVEHYPELIMFAQDIAPVSSEALREVMESGARYGLNELFKTQKHVDAEGNEAYRFVHEQDVLDLLLTMDGSKTTTGFMGFLDDETLNDGNLLQTIMTVLPRRSACDALEDLITEHADEFRNLNAYDIINISGARVSGYGKYGDINGVLQRLSMNADSGKRSMILTVNKMLTGVTIPELTAMFYMKDTTSPQEYYQAMGRLFSSWVSEYDSLGLADDTVDNANNAGSTHGMFDRKRNVLFVDFDVEREYRMTVELARSITTINERRQGRTSADALQRIFDYIPVFTMNADAITRCEPVNVLETINKHRGPGIRNALNTLTVDDGIIEGIIDSDYEDFFLRELAPFDNDARRNIQTYTSRMTTSRDGSQALLTVPTVNTADTDNNADNVDTDNSVDSVNNANSVDNGNSADNVNNGRKYRELLRAQVKSYYRLLLLFTVLTDSHVYALADIVRVLGDAGNGTVDDDRNRERDRRIAENLGIRLSVCEWMLQNMGMFELDGLDSVIMGIRLRMEGGANGSGDKAGKLERMLGELDGVDSLSSQEVRLPYGIALDMVSGKLVDSIQGAENQKDFTRNLRETITGIVGSGESIMDWSCDGVISRALYDYMTGAPDDGGLGLDRDMVARSITAVPTSGLSYELIRYAYECLGIPVGNIAGFTMMDMLDAARTGRNTYDYGIIGTSMHADNVRMLADVRLADNVGSVRTGCIVDSGDGMVKNRMKIGLVVGNPPYQSKKSTNTLSLYDRFMDVASTVSDEYVMVTPAKFLANAGYTPKSWNKKMLGSKHYQVIHYYENSNEVFDDVAVIGGIVISHYDNNHNYSPIKTFIFDSVLRSIVKKCVDGTTVTIDEIIHEQTRFDLEKLYRDYPQMKDSIGSNGGDKRFRSNCFDKYPNIFLTVKPNDGHSYAKIYGLYHRKRCTKWIREDYINTESQKNYDKYTVLVPESAAPRKAFGEKLSELIIGEPSTGYTQTYLGISSFGTIDEANNCMNYVKTKFARTLLYTLKMTQNNTRSTWANIPVQDFTEDSDIDWSKSISEIDRQLYAKYGLSDEEIEYIETHVQPME